MQREVRLLAVAACQAIAILAAKYATSSVAAQMWKEARLL